MKKYLVVLLAGAVLFGATTASQAAVLFTYSVLVDGGPIASYTESSGAPGVLDVTAAFPFGSPVFDASGDGTDIDIADIAATQTPASATNTNFDGSTSSYTFDIEITDVASGLSGTFTVMGSVIGSFRELPGASYGLGNTYVAGFAPNEQPTLTLGINKYNLNFPKFGADFDAPAPFGSWTFNVSAVPEPGSLALLLGVGVSSSLFFIRRRK
jgi:hypothetical protein